MGQHSETDTATEMDDTVLAVINTNPTPPQKDEEEPEMETSTDSIGPHGDEMV